MTSSTIHNVYCVGRNYRAHAEELGNAVPEEPMLFTKPTHAVVPLNGGSVRLTGSQGSVHFEGELVLRVGRAYEPGIRVDELIDQMTLGIDFTLRDVQSKAKAKGQPWLAAKGFRNSAPIGEWIPFPGEKQLLQSDFTLLKNGIETQRGNISRMIFPLQTIIDFCAEHYGLGEGDIIFTGTPEGVGPVASGDQFELRFGERTIGSATITLE